MDFTASSYYGVMGSREKFIFKPVLPVVKSNSGMFFFFSELSIVSNFKLMNLSPSAFLKQCELEF